MTERIANGFEQIDRFKSELSRLPGVVNVSGAAHDFGNGGWMNIGYTDESGVYRTFDMNAVDEEYTTTMGMTLVQGRGFSSDVLSDKARGVIVNEAFAREYGWTNAIGQRIPGKAFLDHEIIGVVKDFNYTSLYSSVSPMLMVHDPKIILAGSENISIGSSPVPKLIVRLRPGNMIATVDAIKGVWSEVSGQEEFIFNFTDEVINKQYRADQNLGRIVSIASLIAILIGSLGLFALASLALQSRTKEVSVRKVFGASIQSLLILLSKDFVFLVLISLCLSIPLTYLIISDWLNGFAYRIDIGWEVFLLTGMISLLVAMLTIAYQTIRTALSQPAETLKHE